MRWAKIILLFQAIITLIIGIAFFSQLTKIGGTEIPNLVDQITEEQPSVEEVSNRIEDLRTRYTVASYILLVVGLAEAILILRLLS